MNRIIDLIRNNLFWILMALAVVGLALVYVFVARSMAADVNLKRGRISENSKAVRDLANRPVIANDAMIEATQREQAKLETIQGQLILLYADRSDFLDEPFEAIRGVDDSKFSSTEMLLWSIEYTARIDELKQKARDRFGAPDNAFPFRPFRPGPKPGEDLALIKKLQSEFWTLSAVFDTLSAASPQDAPLVERLEGVRPRGGLNATMKHDWLRSIPIAMRVSMPYRKVGQFIAALQNLPRPIRVNSYMVRRPGGSGGGPVEKNGVPLVDVEFACELIEFRPMVETIRFSGMLFENKEAVDAWVGREAHLLDVLLRAVSQKMPTLARRSGETAVDVSVLYDRLYPLVPQKAHFIGEGPSDRRLLIVGVPDRVRYVGRTWWVMQREGGSAYPAKNRNGSPVTRQQMVRELTAGSKQDAVLVDDTDPSKLTLLVDTRARKVVRALMAEPDGGWRTYPAMEYEGQPVWVGDTAFRFGRAVVIAAGRIADLDPDSKQLRLVPPDVLQGSGVQEFDVDVKGELGGAVAAGKMRIRIGLRK